MIEFTELTKNVGGEITIYPYRDIEDEDWPTYYDPKTDSDEQKLPEGWRDVGFKVKYPTVSRMTLLKKKFSGVYMTDEGMSVSANDPKDGIKFIIEQLITGLEGVSQDGEPMPYEKKAKKWLYDQFQNSSFLLSHFRREYEEKAEKIKAREQEKEDDFLDGSDESSSTSSTDTETSDAQ